MTTLSPRQTTQRPTRPRRRHRAPALLASLSVLGLLGVMTTASATGPTDAAPTRQPVGSVERIGPADTDVAGLEVHEGNLTITKPGTVVDGLFVQGNINVRADDVTIRNTVVAYAGYHSVRIFHDAEGTRILDSSVYCLTPRTNGVVFGDYYAEGVSLTGCRNDFMGAEQAHAVVVDSFVDGEPYSSPDAEQPTAPEPPDTGLEPEPTPDPTPSPTDPTDPGDPSDPDPTDPTDPDPSQPSNPDPDPIVIDPSWPTPDSTGPRTEPTTSTGSLTSSSDGQVISGVEVNGRLTIMHDNVTVRDVVVNGQGTYMIQVVETESGDCPENVLIEYTEIDGANAAENDIPLYSPRCGYTFDHGYVHNVGRTSRLVHDTTISNSYIFSDRTGDSGAHRGAVGTNGGSNNQIINNVLMCEGTGCSAAIPMYGDFRPVDGLLVQHNLLATTGSYCAYGGSLDSKPYPDGSNIRFIDNHFARTYFDTCGRYGPITGFEDGVRGNVWEGNVWHDTGEEIQVS